MSGPLEAALGFYSDNEPVFQLEAEVDEVLSRVAFDNYSLGDLRKARKKLKRWEKFVESNLFDAPHYTTSPVLLAISCLRDAYLAIMDDQWEEIYSPDPGERSRAAQEILGENFFLGGEEAIVLACELNEKEASGKVGPSSYYSSNLLTGGLELVAMP
jgi:hypothetical protein